MKTAIFAIALMASGAAIAQTYPDDVTTPATDVGVATDMNSADSSMTTTMSTTPSTGQIQAPSNANPERDARGIAVISDAAVVPAGYNGTSGTGVGGPLLDPVTGEAMSTTTNSYPACTRSVTDNCVQTYERGRAPQ